MSEDVFSNEEINKLKNEAYLNIMNKHVPDAVRQVKSGDIEGAKTLCVLASEFLSAGIDLPIDLKNYLIEAFQAIAQGESADKALYLKHRRGKNNTNTYKKSGLALHILALVALGLVKSVENACEIVSEQGAVIITNSDNSDNSSYFVDSKTAYKYFYEIYPGDLSTSVNNFIKFAKNQPGSTYAEEVLAWYQCWCNKE